MTIKDVINYCLSLSPKELENFAGQHYVKLLGFITAQETGVDPHSILKGAIFTCIAQDATLSEAEYRFISSFIGGYDYESALLTASAFYNSQSVEMTKNLFNILPPDKKESFLCLCIAILAVDGNFDGAEVEFLAALLDS